MRLVIQGAVARGHGRKPPPAATRLTYEASDASVPMLLQPLLAIVSYC